MSTSNVRAARESERSRVIATIVAGFIADPVARWCWPDSESYLTNMERFANAYGGKAFRHGSAWTDADFRGSALWLPPDEHPDEEELRGIVAASLEERKQILLLAALGELGTYHPDEPHWFLPLIAVDPAWQGKGVGSRLMQHAVEQCDATATRAYLESSNPRNIPLYERHGFRVVGEVQRGDCPVFTPMVRRPTNTRTP